MLNVRRANERGHTQLNWLDSHHTFSFDQYYDPKYMGFGPLRVINEDIVDQGQGFGTHSHREMEILTYILEGELEHKDSLGTGSTIRPGELQRMSAGTGISHSEFNHSSTDKVHLLQIWIEPGKKGLPPGYEQKKFDLPAGELVLLGSPDGSGVVTIHQNVRLYGFRLNPGKLITADLHGGSAWLQVARGRLTVDGETVEAGDAVAIKHGTRLNVHGLDQSAEALLFVFPPEP